MKKFICLLAAVLMLMSLAACGGGEENYKYDAIPGLLLDHMTLSQGQYRPVKGGAYGAMSSYDYHGEDFPVDEWGSNFLMYIFDERSKVILPACMDPACTHDTEECFANIADYVPGSSYWNIHEDMIVIGHTSFKNYGPSEIRQYTFFYFTLDGTLVDTKSFSMKSLVREDGQPAESPSLNFAQTHAKDGKVYTVIFDSADYEPGVKRNSWIVCYDLETKEFTTLGHFMTADGLSLNIYITEVTDTHIGVEYDRRFGYCLDLETGECVETDCAAIFTEAMAAGKVSGSFIEGIYPVTGAIYIPGYPDPCYLSMTTGEKLDPEEVMNCRTVGMFSLYYEGDTYSPAVGSSQRKFVFRRMGDGSKVNISRYFENGTYWLADTVMESENGVIYKYYNNGETYEDAQYEVTENGKTVLYEKAARLVYVEKSDMFDGTVDSPWYYDGETGMFVRPE